MFPGEGKATSIPVPEALISLELNDLAEEQRENKL